MSKIAKINWYWIHYLATLLGKNDKNMIATVFNITLKQLKKKQQTKYKYELNRLNNLFCY